MKLSYPKLIDRLAQISDGSVSKEDITIIISNMNEWSMKNDSKVAKYTKKALVELSKKLENEDRRNAVISGNLSRLGHKRSGDNYWENAFRNFAFSNQGISLGAAGETDEVVTIDVKRVIRHPTSLHGKSGFCVTEFPLDRLDPDKNNSFDPLSETIVFSDSNNMSIKVIKDDIDFRIKEREFSMNAGDEAEVSEAVGTFLILKGWATQHSK